LKRFLFFLTVLALSMSAAHAERRVALVIGNSAYQSVPQLKNPHNDAAGMSDKLTALGFEVVTGLDLSLMDTRQKVREFVEKLAGADLALFFYAGHGIQVNGENYLIPVDAQLKSDLDLDFEAVPANLILTAMERATKINLVFLDACRDNPFAENLARSMGTRSSAIGRGLAKIGSGVGSLISFSTQPGNVALDGSGENSPFTTALLKHLGTPGQDVTRDLVLVRRDVLAATNGQQVPWDNSSLTGEVILRAVEEEKPAEVKAPSEVPAVNPQIELAYWDSIKSGETIAYFETYLNRYPEGQFADIARLRIEEIKARAERDKLRQDVPDATAEITFWQSIQNANSAEMFQSYIDQYPSGLYSKLAVLKIEALRRQAAAEAQASIQASTNPAQGPVVANLTPADTVPQPVTPGTSRSLTPQELAAEMQTELNRLGCSVGKVDGDWGNRSRLALKIFGAEAGVELASLDPDPLTLDRLKKSTGRICPTVCGRDQEIRNGKCVAIRTKTPSSTATKAPSDNASKQKTKTQTASSCPGNPTGYGNRLFAGAKGLSMTGLRHPCGQQFSCKFSGWPNVYCWWQ
jgi:uncharacterized caspase-like protein